MHSAFKGTCVLSVQIENSIIHHSTTFISVINLPAYRYETLYLFLLGYRYFNLKGGGRGKSHICHGVNHIMWNPYKARMTRTLIWAIMSSLLCLLSYSLKICGQRTCTSIYWSWASYVTITSIRVNNWKYINSPVRELHSYLPITKRVHYYYANQAK